ncbi:MAG TPA: hypothetical protein VNM36_10840 [Gemmatimonadaceae bacterium]|jgi:hypothetical protein|nr:hypothetical protein [Gemmatimonadaceae bacterium]
MLSSTRRATTLVASAASLALLSACGDANIRKLNTGIARDSVLKILAIGSTSTDSTPNVYREERYLNDGQWISMLLYTNTGKKEGADTVPEADLIPVVLRNDTLTGWGWEHHDSVARANKIVIKPRGK